MSPWPPVNVLESGGGSQSSRVDLAGEGNTASRSVLPSGTAVLRQERFLLSPHCIDCFILQ